MLKKTIAVTAMTAALVGGVLVTPGLAAGKGGGKGNTTTSTTGSISVNQADPRLGDWVDFTTVVPSGVANPRVQIMCYQNDVLTYAMADTNTTSFELGGGSSAWRTNGGAALCTADLFEWKYLKTAHAEYVVYATSVFAAGDRAVA